VIWWLLSASFVALFCPGLVGRVLKKKTAAAAAAFICALAVDRRFSFALSLSPVAVWDVVLFRSVVWWCADYTMSGAFQWH